MNACAPVGIVRAVDHRGAVGDVGLEVGRQVDRLERAVGGDDIGDVDEAGVDGALGELADDPGDVGLERAHVVEDRPDSSAGSPSRTSRV